MDSDLKNLNAVDEAAKENLTHIVYVETCPYERIAEFGFSLARFAEAHPGMQFSWYEADYANPDFDDDVEIDDLTVFEADPDWSTFLVSFEDKAGYDAYETWGTARDH